MKQWLTQFLSADVFVATLVVEFTLTLFFIFADFKNMYVDLQVGLLSQTK